MKWRPKDGKPLTFGCNGLLGHAFVPEARHCCELPRPKALADALKVDEKQRLATALMVLYGWPEAACACLTRTCVARLPSAGCSEAALRRAAVVFRDASSGTLGARQVRVFTDESKERVFPSFGSSHTDAFRGAWYSARKQSATFIRVRALRGQVRRSYECEDCGA